MMFFFSEASKSASFYVSLSALSELVILFSLQTGKRNVIAALCRWCDFIVFLYRLRCVLLEGIESSLYQYRYQIHLLSTSKNISVMVK